MLDHATGYLMAFGAMMAKARQAGEGGDWHVRLSLAQTGRWLWNGRIEGAMKARPAGGDCAEYIQAMPSGLGELSAVRHSAILSKTPARWARPAMPLGSHKAGNRAETEPNEWKPMRLRRQRSLPLPVGERGWVRGTGINNEAIAGPVTSPNACAAIPQMRTCTMVPRFCDRKLRGLKFKRQVPVAG